MTFTPLGEQLAQAEAERDLAKEALQKAKDMILMLKEEVEKLGHSPYAFGTVVEVHPDEELVDIITSGRKMRVTASTGIPLGSLAPGQEVVINESLNIVLAEGFEVVGSVCTVRSLLGDGLATVENGNTDQVIVRLAGPLLGETLKEGDRLLFEPKTAFAYKRLPKIEGAEVELEEVPDIAYSDIGGLARQVEQIRDAIELPYLHKDLFADYDLKPPKGVLLYGAPGCGKTLIAKAVANSLAKQSGAAQSFFLNIKGPELLNKWVGETERHIRLVFQRARDAASEGHPVIVFFDEMESLFRIRGSGVSSDVENTIVPQLLAEIDGVEGLENVIVIGASNREDMIDPAILRPGRLDVKIKIERPDAEAASDIFAKYLVSSLPIHTDERDVEHMILDVVRRMYAENDDNRFLEVTYEKGEKEVLYFKDFASGAMIKNIVDRAKRIAIKEQLATGARGIRTDHLMVAVTEEFRENEDLPNTTNPDDWARISGRKGEKIAHVRTLVNDTKVDNSTVHVGGQYL